MINWFVDFKREFTEIGLDTIEAYSKVVKGGWFVLGPECAEFEEQFAKYTGSAHCVSVGNGTDAIEIALRSLDLPKEAKVLTTPLTAAYTALAIQAAGLTPVFADVDDALNMDPESNSKKDIKAIVPVHLYGNPCHMETILNFSKNAGALVVEDCAQAHGAKYNDRLVGSFGNIACYSFYPTKNLGAYGDGGAITTNDKEFFERIKIIREGGQTKKYQHDFYGVNSRLDEVQAAVLKVKLKYLEKWTLRRKEIAKFYLENLKEVGDIRFPKVSNLADPVYHLFVLMTSKREELSKYLDENGIKTAIHYPIPLHLQGCFSYLGYKKGDFPKAEKACREVLTIPLHPYLTDDEVEEVVGNINKFFS